MNQIISFSNSNLYFTRLEIPFEAIQPGDFIRLTKEVCVQHYNDHQVEIIVFEKLSGLKVKLTLHQILCSKGSVGSCLRTAISNKDIKIGYDLFEILLTRQIRVDKIEFVDKFTSDGKMFRSKVYTLNWC